MRRKIKCPGHPYGYREQTLTDRIVVYVCVALIIGVFAWLAATKY
jgi:hypothetical protein